MTLTTSFLKTTGATLANSAACPKLAMFFRPALPDEVGLVGMYVFGGSLAASQRNLVAGGAALTTIGSPTIDPVLGATCNRDNCFNTGLPETLAYSYIVVVKPTATDNPCFPVGNWDKVTHPRGTQIYVGRGGGSLVQGIDANSDANVGVGVGIDATVAGDWYAFCGEGDANGMSMVSRHGGVTSAEQSQTPGGHALSTRPLLIGGHYDPSEFDGYGSILFAAIWNKKLSATNREATLSAVAKFFADFGGVTTL